MNNHFDPKTYDDLFDSASSDGLDKWIEEKESIYEDRMVKRVVVKLNLADHMYDLKSEASYHTGVKNESLTFNHFHNIFPTFPVRLCAKSYVKVNNITIVDLYKRFTTCHMYETFMQMKDLIPDGEQYGSSGLIFQWSGLGHMILHDCPMEIKATRFLKLMGNKTAVYLDMLSEFLDSMNVLWRP